MPELSDLPLSSQQAIDKIKAAGDPGICSRCRYGAGCLSCSVAKAERYYLNLLRWDLGLPKLCTTLSFPCSFCHFLETMCSLFNKLAAMPLCLFLGDVCSALDDGWPPQLSGAAFWRSLLVQPSGAAFWCSSLVHHFVSPLQLSGAAFCFTLCRYHSDTFGVSKNTASGDGGPLLVLSLFSGSILNLK